MKSNKLFIVLCIVLVNLCFSAYSTNKDKRVATGLAKEHTNTQLNSKLNDVKLLNEADFLGEVDGKAIALFTLKNKSGLVAQITNFGGRVVALWTPDRLGEMDDIVTGHANLKKYLSSKEVYFGALIGRYGNRIAKGEFQLDNTKFQLAQNNNGNSLHGGPKGFHNVVWDARSFKTPENEDALELKYISKNGEEGYPGNLSIVVIYTLTNNNELKIDYSATTDKNTVLNLTNHTFFNLHGFKNGESKSVDSHQLQLNASYYIPTDENLIPTGEIASVKGTPMDFTKLKTIGDRVNNDYPALKYGKGYDHNWILNKKGNALTEAGMFYEPSNGRVMRIFTTEPAVQFYGGNFFNASEKGKYGELYIHRSAFAIETQHYPDSPNHPNFPTTELKPGEKYQHTCIYKFEIK